MTKNPCHIIQRLPRESIFEKDLFHTIYIERPREAIYHRINNRFDLMLENGVLSEALSVVQIGYKNLPPAHGLPELIKYFTGDISLDEAVNRAKQITRNYAKRQMTWARNQWTFDKVISL